MLKTILIVEDDQTMRELLQLHLTNAGYAVRAAENGIEAIRQMLGVLPDMIISDINMPDMNGVELVTAIKQDPSAREIPVIFLTLEYDAHEQAARLGAVACLSKPIKVDDLLKVVAQHFPAAPAGGN